jgi:hypothetical protein
MEPIWLPDIPDPLTRIVEFLIETSSIGDSESGPADWPPIPGPESLLLSSTSELEIKRTPMDDLLICRNPRRSDPSPVPVPVPIPDPHDKHVATTVEFKRVTLPIAEAPPESQSLVPIPEPLNDVAMIVEFQIIKLSIQCPNSGDQADPVPIPRPPIEASPDAVARTRELEISKTSMLAGPSPPDPIPQPEPEAMATIVEFQMVILSISTRPLVAPMPEPSPKLAASTWELEIKRAPPEVAIPEPNNELTTTVEFQIVTAPL